MVRFKNRYFLCEIISEDLHFQQSIDEWAVHNTVKNVVARMHGDFGLGWLLHCFFSEVSRRLHQE
uniref:GekBS082P n=1 Tax=Gekko japonicus TaxID=146911 RepID=Q5I1C4_GEKJA|nr:GekBS082P [Gekko japonicus]